MSAWLHSYNIYESLHAIYIPPFNTVNTYIHKCMHTYTLQTQPSFDTHALTSHLCIIVSLKLVAFAALFVLETALPPSLSPREPISNCRLRAITAWSTKWIQKWVVDEAWDNSCNSQYIVAQVETSLRFSIVLYYLRCWMFERKRSTHLARSRNRPQILCRKGLRYGNVPYQAATQSSLGSSIDFPELTWWWNDGDGNGLSTHTLYRRNGRRYTIAPRSTRAADAIGIMRHISVLATMTVFHTQNILNERRVGKSSMLRDHTPFPTKLDTLRARERGTTIRSKNSMIQLFSESVETTLCFANWLVAPQGINAFISFAPYRLLHIQVVFMLNIPQTP